VIFEDHRPLGPSVHGGTNHHFARSRCFNAGPLASPTPTAVSTAKTVSKTHEMFIATSFYDEKFMPYVTQPLSSTAFDIDLLVHRSTSFRFISYISFSCRPWPKSCFRLSLPPDLYPVLRLEFPLLKSWMSLVFADNDSLGHEQDRHSRDGEPWKSFLADPSTSSAGRAIRCIWRYRI